VNTETAFLHYAGERTATSGFNTCRPIGLSMLKSNWRIFRELYQLNRRTLYGQLFAQ